MSLDDRIKSALGVFLQNHCYVTDLDYVMSWEDRVIYGGYCETCAYETTGIEVTYKTTKGGTKTYEIEESFSQLMNRL